MSLSALHRSFPSIPLAQGMDTWSPAELSLTADECEVGSAMAGIALPSLTTEASSDASLLPTPRRGEQSTPEEGRSSEHPHP